jgi:hypothetical protein
MTALAHEPRDWCSKMRKPSKSSSSSNPAPIIPSDRLGDAHKLYVPPQWPAGKEHARVRPVSCDRRPEIDTPPPGRRAVVLLVTNHSIRWTRRRTCPIRPRPDWYSTFRQRLTRSMIAPVARGRPIPQGQVSFRCPLDLSTYSLRFKI